MDKFCPKASTTSSHDPNDVHSQAQSFLDATKGAYASPVTPQELHSALRASGAWKAPGPDRVVNIFLRKCEDILSPYLLTIFSASLRLQALPQDWKMATIVAVPKPGADLTQPKGYRPISLLSCISKVLERIVTDRLSFFLETRGLLSSVQFGFRRTRSTEGALWNFITQASKGIQNH